MHKEDFSGLLFSLQSNIYMSFRHSLRLRKNCYLEVRLP